MFSKSIVKYIQSLQHKKFRDEHNAFVAEGPKVVAELISGGKFACRNIYAVKSWIDEHAAALKPSLRAHITEVQDFELEKLSGLATANQVIAEFSKIAPHKPVLKKEKISLMLDDIRDPGNLGTIIRTADWFGVQDIICSLNTVDMYNPKVVQSTMASLGNVHIFYTDLPGFLQENDQIQSYAATLKGADIRAQKIDAGILIIGNEAKGISAELLNLAHKKVSIPGAGNAESLNAAVATGILMFAAS